MNKLFTLSCIIFMTFMSSCSEDDPKKDEPVKSSEKNVLSFSFLKNNANYVALVSATEITFTIPFDVDIESVSPTLTISAGASVEPASGVVQNLRLPLSYTVTAEDGTQKVYPVKVNRTASDVTVNALANLQNKPGDYVVVTGTNFGIYKEDNVLQLEGTDGDIVPVTDFNFDVASRAISFNFPTVPKSDLFKLKVTVLNKSGLSPTFQVLNGVRLTSVLRNIYTPGDYYFAKYKFLEVEKVANSAYKVYIQKDGDSEIQLTASIMIDKAEIYFPVMPPGTYTLKIKTVSETFVLTTSLIVLDLPGPVMTSINKTTFVQGEEIIITGTNLKAPEGTVQFTPRLEFKSGLSTKMVTMQPANLNADGTQIRYTIPSDGFLVGTFEFKITLNNQKPNIWPQPITINP